MCSCAPLGRGQVGWLTGGCAGLYFGARAERNRAAKSLDELVEKGFLKPLPALPPGKRYDLDQRSVTLTIVDK